MLVVFVTGTPFFLVFFACIPFSYVCRGVTILLWFISLGRMRLTLGIHGKRLEVYVGTVVIVVFRLCNDTAGGTLWKHEAARPALL